MDINGAHKYSAQFSVSNHAAYVKTKGTVILIASTERNKQMSEYKVVKVKSSGKIRICHHVFQFIFYRAGCRAKVFDNQFH